MLYTSTLKMNILSGGQFYFDVPASTNSPYLLTMKINDKDKQLVGIVKEIIVPATANTQLSIGKIGLTLPNGAGCVGNGNIQQCLRDNQAQAYGRLNVVVRDSDSNNLLSGVNLGLYNGHLVAAGLGGPRADTNQEGRGQFSDLQYGYYTIVATRSGYVEQVKTVIVESGQTDLDIYVVPNKKTLMDLSLMIENAQSVDTDLKLMISDDKGKDCLVSAENKYCAYSLYLYDVQGGQSGMETIRIHNLTMAYYMVFT